MPVFVGNDNFSGGLLMHTAKNYDLVPCCSQSLLIVLKQTKFDND